MQELHLLVVLFGLKLVSNISTKALKKAPYSKPDWHFFNAQIRYRFNEHFSWVLTALLLNISLWLTFISILSTVKLQQKM